MSIRSNDEMINSASPLEPQDLLWRGDGTDIFTHVNEKKLKLA